MNLYEKIKDSIKKVIFLSIEEHNPSGTKPRLKSASISKSWICKIDLARVNFARSNAPGAQNKVGSTNKTILGLQII